MALFDTTFAPYVPFGSRTLSEGDSGTDVALIQAIYDLMLKTMNPPEGPMGGPIEITGQFGSGTVIAVKNIQSYFGLAADGVVGERTYFLFGQGVGADTTYGGPVYGSRQLSQGNAGGDVTILQNRLNCFRYASMIGHPADGSFGSATANAVLAFKQDAERNGDTGFPSNAIAGFGFYDATWLYTFAGGRAIFTGRNGFDVVFIQVHLQKLGYYTDRVTGYYDTATESAVKAFQTAQNISSDGVVGPVTFYHFGLQNNVSAPTPLDIAWPAAPAPSVSVCSTALVTTTSDLHPYGAATLAINEREGFESLDVVGNMLPSPGSFGMQYTQYIFTLTDPSTGNVVVIASMVMIPGPAPNDWAGTYSPGVKTIPQGTVTVYAATSAPGPGFEGPSVLKGDLGLCH